MSRYEWAYRDRREGWPLGELCHILYRDKRAVWLRACHDTIDCIVTVGERPDRWLCRDTDVTRPEGSIATRRRGVQVCGDTAAQA